MNISEQAIAKLEAVLTHYEVANGVIDLNAMVTTNCQCTGAHCSTGCSGNKGQVW